MWQLRTNKNPTEINEINKHLKVNRMSSHAIRMIKYKDTARRDESMKQSNILKIITAKCFTRFALQQFMIFFECCF